MRTRNRAVLLACIGIALLIAAALAFVVVAMAASGSDPTFRSKLFFGASVSEGAAEAAVGDVNGDGRSDVVIADYYPESGVSVQLNEGRGDFKGRAYSLPDPGALSVALAELNGDAKPDLVVTTADESEEPAGVSVFLNRGDGTFRSGPATLLAPATFGAAGDLNGDGKADIVAVDAKRAAIAVLLNRGAGGFDPAHEQYATGKRISAVAIADVNRDGKADVATANSADNTVSVLLNDGNGVFAARRDYRTGREPEAMAVQDLNGDGRPDLVTANARAPSVSVLLNGGDGTFGSRRRDYKTAGGAAALAIGDVNGDRKPDVVVRNASESVSVLVNSGDGSFRPRLDYDYQFEGQSLALADMTGDHRRDVVVLVHNSRNSDNWLAVLVNTPGVCNVLPLAGMTVVQAKRTLARVNCRVGTIKRVSSAAKRGLVTAQKPAFGTVLPSGARVDLVVSKGRR